jgi:hypothetical protein
MSRKVEKMTKMYCDFCGKDIAQSTASITEKVSMPLGASDESSDVSALLGVTITVFGTHGDNKRLRNDICRDCTLQAALVLISRHAAPAVEDEIVDEGNGQPSGEVVNFPEPKTEGVDIGSFGREPIMWDSRGQWSHSSLDAIPEEYDGQPIAQIPGFAGVVDIEVHRLEDDSWDVNSTGPFNWQEYTEKNPTDVPTGYFVFQYSDDDDGPFVSFARLAPEKK